MGKTTRSRKSRHNRRAETALCQTRKVEAVDRLASGIAQELNNYLGAMQGYCEFAKMKCPGDDALAHCLDAAMGTAADAAALVRQLLAYSREQLSRSEVVDLDQLVAGMEDVMRQVAEGVAAGPQAEPATVPLRILLVEDDPMRQTAEHLLKALGYDVLVASGGERALRLLAQEQAPLDLVIIDVMMPGLSGPQLLARIREEREAIGCLFISGYTDEATLRHGLGQGKADFLRKPFTARSLSDKINALLSAV